MVRSWSHFIHEILSVRDGCALCCLLWALLVGLVTLLAFDPLQVVGGMSIPNVAHDALELPPINATVDWASQGHAEYAAVAHELKDEEGAWLSAPKHMWPTANQRFSDGETARRLGFWMTVSLLVLLVTVMLGTGVLQLSSKTSEYQEVEREGKLRRSKVMFVLCSLAVLAHLTLVTKFTVQGALTDRLTPEYGACWELYVLVLLYLCFWLLLQALCLPLWRRRGRFGLLTFAEAAWKTLVPFVADPFDTVKDGLMAGMALNFCLQRQQVLWRRFVAGFVGGLSLLYLWVFHILMLRGSASRLELEAAYLSVLSLPDKEAGEADAGAGNGTSSGTGAGPACIWVLPQRARAWVLPKVLLQTMPERQRALVREDVPQGVMAVVFLAARGWQPQVALCNLCLPLLRLVGAWLLYPLVARQEALQLWLLSESRRFQRCGNTPRAKNLFLLLLDAIEQTPPARRQGRRELAEALLQGEPLDEFTRVLNFSERRLGLDFADLWAITFANAVLSQGWPELRELRLNGNEIMDAGAEALAAALPSLPQLRELGLSGNCIGDSGAAALAEALSQLPQLQELDLTDNYMGNYYPLSLAGVQALAQAAERHDPPIHLKLNLFNTDTLSS